MVAGLTPDASIGEFVAALSRFGVIVPPSPVGDGATRIAEPRIDKLRIDDRTLARLHARFNVWAIRFPWIVEELAFVPASEVADAQRGYDGSGWLSDWFVFARDAGDPVFVDRRDGTVWTAVHGAGKWFPVRLAPSTDQFLLLAAAWIDALTAHGGSPLDADFMPNPAFLRTMEERSARLGVSADGVRAVWNAGC